MSRTLCRSVNALDPEKGTSPRRKLLLAIARLQIIVESADDVGHPLDDRESRKVQHMITSLFNASRLAEMPDMTFIYNAASAFTDTYLKKIGIER